MRRVKISVSHSAVVGPLLLGNRIGQPGVVAPMVSESGKGAAERFDKLLAACHAFASSRGATVEAGVNLAREQAYQRMRSHGYRVAMQGVAMQRPHEDGFNRADTYVIDDWR